MEALNYESCYLLKRKITKQRPIQWGWIEERIDPYELKCGVVEIGSPIRLAYSSGDEFFDIMDINCAVLKVYSSRVVCILNHHGFTGVRPIPVLLSTKDEEDVSGYFILSILGRSNPIDRSRSTDVILPPRITGSPTRKSLQGMYFKDDQWDGSDIFMPEGTSIIVVTEKVKNSLENLDSGNLAFVRLTEEYI